jgi:hypothetical protein
MVLLAVGAGAASANSAPYTRGDAVALFNAGSTGGIRGEGAPADRSARIGPGPAFNGFHVCADDWHVLFINLITTDATDGLRTVGEARILAAAVEVTYELDGAPLPVERTPVKPWLGDPTTLAPDATVAFSFHTGAVLAPDALAPGAHTERVRIYIDGVLWDDLGDVTFHVDPSGTGTCV